MFQCVYTSNYDFYLIKKRKKREKFLPTRYFTTSRSTCNKYLRFELSTTLNYESILLITRSITNVYYTLNIERYVKKKKKRRDSTIKVKKIVLFLKGFFTVRVHATVRHACRESSVCAPLFSRSSWFRVMLTLAETRIKSILCITAGESPYESCREIVGTRPIRAGPFRTESIACITEIDRYSVGSCGPNIDFVSSYNLLRPPLPPCAKCVNVIVAEVSLFFFPWKMDYYKNHCK